MRYRNPKKEGDLFSMIEYQQSVLKAVKGINKLKAPSLSRGQPRFSDTATRIPSTATKIEKLI